TLLSTPSPGCTIMGPIWTSNCGGHRCVTVPPYVRATSRSFIRVLLLEGRLDNHGLSGLRLRTTRQRDATRSHTAMRGNCTTEDGPGTATYCLMVILLRLTVLNWRGRRTASSDRQCVRAFASLFGSFRRVRDRRALAPG